MFNLNDLRQHNWAIVGLIIFNFFVYIGMLGFNALAAVPLENNKVFPSSVGNVSDYFFVDITPASWVFSIVWTTIFIWNLIWLIYAMVCIYRRAEDGSYFYRKYDFFHWGLFIAFSFNNIAIIVWLFVWTNAYVGWAFLVIILTVVPLDICILILSRKAYVLSPELEKHGFKRDVYLIRILPLNGIGFFTTWLTLATNLNFAQFLTIDAGAKDYIGGTIALINILGAIIIYSIFENLVWYKYLMYMFTPWFVVIFALIGSLAKNWVSGAPTRNNILTLIILIVACFGATVKIVFFRLYQTKWRGKVDIEARPSEETNEMVYVKE